MEEGYQSEEGEVEKGREKREIRQGIAQEVAAGIKDKTGALDDHKEQLGTGSSKIGTVRKSKTEKRRKRRTGKRKTRWEGNGLRMRSWRRVWNEEGGKEAP